MQKIVHIDMDGVLCDFMGAFRKGKRENPSVKFPQSVVGFFEKLEPIPNAIESAKRLIDEFDVYILTAPSTRNPHCYSEKRIWIEKQFGYELTEKLIISPNKGLVKGDYLIDDHDSGRGQESFEGELILFGSDQFRNWSAVMKKLLPAG